MDRPHGGLTVRGLGLVPLLLLVAGCGGAAVVERAEVERQTRESLTRGVGQQAPPVECPDPLKAEVGAKTRCSMDFPDGKRLGITVTVETVDGDRVNFGIEADQQPTDAE